MPQISVITTYKKLPTFVLQCLIIFTTTISFSQNIGAKTVKDSEFDFKPPSHFITFESGAWSRGLIGLGYNNNFNLKANDSFISSQITVGTKYPWVNPQPDFFSTVAFAYNKGNDNKYFTVGVETKYIIVEYWTSVDLAVGTSLFNGFTYGAFLGRTFFQSNKWIFQVRFSYMRSFNKLNDKKPWYNLEQNHLSALGLSFSLGYSLTRKINMPIGDFA